MIRLSCFALLLVLVALPAVAQVPVGPAPIPTTIHVGRDPFRERSSAMHLPFPTGTTRCWNKDMFLHYQDPSGKDVHLELHAIVAPAVMRAWLGESECQSYFVTNARLVGVDMLAGDRMQMVSSNDRTGDDYSMSHITSLIDRKITNLPYRSLDYPTATYDLRSLVGIVSDPKDLDPGTPVLNKITVDKQDFTMELTLSKGEKVVLTFDNYFKPIRATLNGQEVSVAAAPVANVQNHINTIGGM